jgi:hypothetical protein
MAAHASLSPSAAPRWINCPGSVALCATLPKAPSTFYADEGTAAHALAERCILEKVDADRYKGWHIKLSEKYGEGATFLNPLTCKKMEGFEVDSGMIEAVQIYLDALREPGLPIIPEQRLSLEHIWPKTFGTCDAQIHDVKAGILYVWDYKHGAGVLVDPEENAQAMLYAVGALHAITDKSWVKKVVIGIAQPRHRSWRNEPWETTPAYLEDWVKTVVKPAALATTKKDAPLNPSDKACRWCNAKAICPALLKNALDVAQVAFADIMPAEVPTLVMPNPANMSPDDRAKVATLLTALDDYKTSFFQYLQELAEKGEQTPGWKLVRGRANRKWKSEDLVTTTLEPILGDLLYDRKLKSPAGIEKLKGIDKQALAQLWETPEGKLTLAPVSDKRQAVLPDNPFNYDDL